MSDFRHLAACRPGTGVDPELFFPIAEAGPLLDDQVARAKAVCGVCPVREACLTYALATLPAGIAGGMTEDERRELSGKTRRAAQPGERPLTPGQRDAIVAAAEHPRRRVKNLAGSTRVVLVERGLAVCRRDEKGSRFTVLTEAGVKAAEQLLVATS